MKKFKSLESSNKTRTKLTETEVLEEIKKKKRELNKKIPTTKEINAEATKLTNEQIKKRKTKPTASEKKEIKLNT